MNARRRSSHLKLKRVRADSHFVTNLHWTMARRLLRELRDLTDLEFAELYAEANAERVRRLGPRADLDFPGAAANEAVPSPSEERKIFSVSSMVHCGRSRVAQDAELLSDGAGNPLQGNRQWLCGLRRHLLFRLHDI